MLNEWFANNNYPFITSDWILYALVSSNYLFEPVNNIFWASFGVSPQKKDTIF